ncbi:MAG: zinc metalloprotease HtpX [Alkalispirochaeta sp.]
MTRQILRQKRLRLAQTILLTVAMVGLAGRAVAVVFGAAAGWAALVAIAAMALHAAISQQIALPAGTRRLDRYSAPELYRVLQSLIERAGLSRVPPVYVLPSRSGAAMTTGVGERSMILVSQGVLSVLSMRELAAVLAHEVSHIRNYDLPLFAVVAGMQRITHAVSGMLMMIVFFAFPLLVANQTVIAPTVVLYLSIVPLISLVAQLALLRTREFQADIGAVELTGDAAALASALHRLEEMQRPMFHIRSYHRDTGLSRLLRTHPTTEERIRRLAEVATG